MDNIAQISIEVQDHHFGGIEGLKSILNDYYENEVGQLNVAEQKIARGFIEEGLIVSGKRVAITEGVEKERYGVEPELLKKLLESRLIRLENTHLGKSYEISHDTLVPPIIESYKKRKVVEEKREAEELLKEEQKKLAIEKKKRRRARFYAILGFSLFFLSMILGGITYKQSSHINQVAKAGELRGKGYQMIKNNPSIALKFAQASLKTDPKNTNTQHLMRDLLSEKHPNIFSNEMWLGDYVSSIDFFPDNQHFISSDWKGRINKWSIHGQSIFEIEAHEEAINEVIISSDGNYILTGSVDNHAKLWSKDGKLIQTINQHQTDIQALAFTPNNQSFITGAWDGSLKMWNLNGDLIHDFKSHHDVISDIEVSADGNFLVSVGWDKQLVIWDLKNFKIYKKIENKLGFESVSFLKNENKFWTNSWDGKIQLWNIEGEQLSEFKNKEISVNELVVSPTDGSLFLAQSDNLIREVNTDGEEIRQLKNHEDEVLSIAISKNGKYLVSGGRDYKLTIWPLDGLKVDQTKIPITTHAAVLTPKEKIVAVGRDSSVYILDKEGEVLNKLNGHKDQIYALKISPDGSLIATGDRYGKVIIWDINGEKKLETDSMKSQIRNIIFTKDSQSFLACGNSYETKLFNLRGEVLQTFSGHKGDVVDVKLSNDEKYIITGSRDGTAKLWNMEGEVVQEYGGKGSSIYAVDISSDGQFVVTGGWDRTVILWSIEGDSLMTFNGHTNFVSRLTFAKDNKFLASASEDHTVKVWDLSGNEIQTYLGHDAGLVSLNIDGTGEYITSTDKSGDMQKWMLWNTFLESDKVVKLDDYQKMKYGFNEKKDINEYAERVIKKAKHSEIGSPYYSIPRLKQEIIKTQKRSLIVPININSLLAAKNEVGKAYNNKANFSNSLEEKLFFHQKSINYVYDMFENWPVKKAPPPYYQNVLLFGYADLQLINLALDKTNNIEEDSKTYLKYTAGYEKVLSYLEAKKALVAFYKGDSEAAKSQLLELKDIKLFDGKKGGDFNIPYVHAHGVRLDTSFYLKDLIIQDIDFLVGKNITHPEISNLRSELLGN